MSFTDEDVPSFITLSARLRRRIDDAFDSVVVPPGTHMQWSSFDDAPGGFVVEERETGPASTADGFIVEDQPAESFIPLSEVPRALSLLHLDPDDEIMDVFKKAAAGWGARNSHSNGISKKDWRAVCAALLEGELSDENEEENPVEGEDVGMGGADSGPDSEEYHIEEPSSGTDAEEPSTDEYEEPTRTGSKAKKATKGVQRSETNASKQLTEAQKSQCRQDFARFFPHVPDSELDNQRIMSEDITRISNLLKENLKMEEVMEMLEVFSTSPDQSMNLADFQEMMTYTKLV